MSSRLSSFRFKSLSKTMNTNDKQSISQMTFNESITLPAINSVFKGVKYNDLSFMSGRELKKLRKDVENSVDLGFQSAHENLKSIRNKYDTAKTLRQQKEKKVNSLKQQILKFKTVQDELLGKQNLGKIDTSILYSKLSTIKNQFDQIDIQKKVMLNRINNENKDKVIYTQRIYDLQKELKYLKKQIKIFDNEGKDIFQGEDRAKKLIKKFLEQLKDQNNQREQHIKSIQQEIANRKKVNENNKVRAIQIQNIAQKAMQDKNQMQKKWQKLFLTHTFVATMLRDKMYREMQKFNVVQTAFKNIKIATGVNDSNSLIYKFLNKQNVYGELLGKIAENQGKISNLRLEAEQLYKEHKHLQQEQKELIQIRRKETASFSKQIKQLEIIQERKTNADLLQGKIKAWLNKNMKKFKSFGEQIQQMNPCATLHSLKQRLQRYLKIISKNLDEITNTMNPEEQFILLDNTQFSPKINRIIGKVRKNSVGEQINNSHFQQEPNRYLNQQLDALENDRNQLMKSNEKFLRQVQQKNFQIRRAKIQAMPKQKKREPEKKKVIEED